MERQRIALVSDWCRPRLGGVELQIHDLARHLKARGHTVEIVTSAPGDASIDGVRYHRLALPMLRRWAVVCPSPFALARLRRVLGQGFDVVHAHGVHSSLAVGSLVAASAIGIPSVFTNHSLLRDPLSPPLVKIIYALWARRATLLTAVSAAAVEDTRRITGRDEVHLLPNGIDLGGWPEPRPATGERRIVSVMRLSWTKSPQDLVRAVPRVLASAGDGPPVRFVIVGDGRERQRLQRLARRLGVLGHIDFVGCVPRDEARRLLAQATLAVFTSRLEAFGLALLEARCAGVPLVAMNAGAVGELVTHERDGLLADTTDDIALHVGRLLGDAPLRQRLSAGGRLNLERYGWDQVVRRHLEVYGCAMRRASRHDRRFPAA